MVDDTSATNTPATGETPGRTSESDTDEHDERHDERVASRAALRAAERRAGSDDPERQAAAILEDSDERQRDAALARDPDAPAG